MKNIKLASFVLVLVIVSMSCSLFTPASSKDGTVAGDITRDFDNLPAYDPEAPLPSPGAAALRLLVELDPSVAVLESDLEASEREALTALLAELQVQPGAGNGIQVPFLPSQNGSAKVAIPIPRASYPAVYKLVGDSGNFSFEAMFIGILTSQASDSLAVTPGAGENKSASGAEGSATTNNGINYRKNPDGSTTLELVNKTNASKDGVTANTDSKVTLDGWRCPNEAGQVSFTIKERFNGESGGASYTVELSADVRAEVNDDAKLDRYTIDVTQGTRKVKDGKNVYVESGVTYKAGEPLSNQRLIRSSQEATTDDVSNLSAAGEAAAYNMALGSLLFAESNWLKGGCTEIQATSPGLVQTGSTTSIPVKVIHRIEGIEVPSKLKVALSGEESVEPSSLAKTPGTLKYIAPEENGKTATITLTATSKRGKSTLELKASTGGAAYQIVGGLDEFQTSTAVCDIMGPFTLTGGGFSMRFSGGLSGSYTYSGPFGASGSGSYAISLPNGIGQPGSMTGGGSGCVETPLGTFCDGGTETYSLSPLPEGSCP